MPFKGKSFLTVKGLKTQDLEPIFKSALQVDLKKPMGDLRGVASLVFTESSTRTCSSFEFASHWLGLSVVKLNTSASSLNKGETLSDTLLNLDAMEPLVHVVRHGGGERLSEIAPLLKSPVISGGEGSEEHPTQALLDAFTIYKEFGSIEGLRIIIVGDVFHSRVARSNIILLQQMGAQVAYASPQNIDTHGIERFEKIEDALRWADVCMVLRIQHERHSKNTTIGISEYTKQYQINFERIQLLEKNSILLHPGPVNREVEITSEALGDGRVRVLDQVKNGVCVRIALMAEILGVKLQ